MDLDEENLSVHSVDQAQNIQMTITVADKMIDSKEGQMLENSEVTDQQNINDRLDKILGRIGNLEKENEVQRGEINLLKNKMARLTN